MAESVKEQTSERSGSRLLRYPLRSGSKKEVKPPVVDSASVAARRGRSASNVSKSVSVLDQSVKEKSVSKPPRRLSNPSKTTSPISEIRSKGSSSGIRGKINTPVSDVSKSSSKNKGSVLSSSSYWLTQIKHSEAAAKHSVSLGFFKLALEAGCKPLQRIREELKSYARKHDLAEFGEPVKELFDKYNITENFEQLQVSGTKGSRLTDEDVHSSSSVGVMEQVKRNLLAADAADTTQVKQLKKEKVLKDDSVSKVRKPAATKKPSNIKSAANTQTRNSHKRPQKTKQELDNTTMVNKSDKMPANKDFINALPVQKALEENKENLDTPKVDEITSSEV